MKDLPKANLMNIVDKYLKWEKGFPFHQTHIIAMIQKVHSINKPNFSMTELSYVLDTPAWKD